MNKQNMKYTKENLIAGLEKLEEIRVTNWSVFSLVREKFTSKDPSVSVLQKTWTDRYDFNTKFGKILDLSDENNWRIFQENHQLTFSIFEDRLHCFARLFEGGRENGYISYSYNNTKEGKFDVEFTLPIEFIEHIGKFITGELERILDNEYEDFLEKQRQDWIEKEKNKILGA